MISISGIKYQEKLEKLPYFNKKTAGMLIGKSGKNLDKKIQALLDKGYLVSLKKGLYVTSTFAEKESSKSRYLEYLANVLRYPSYVSLEYILAKNGLIPEAVYSITSITLKTTRTYKNELASFIYRNIKEPLFCGYNTKRYLDNKVKIAVPAKALFDFLYLKSGLTDNLEYQLLEKLRINWEQLVRQDVEEFRAFVKKADSSKMESILEVLEKEVF
ncbi:MAG: hypothetical protein U9M98_00240 [Patescibacteria group bacterium]|nr:hypothetical protein [Patescibacteria group bacterium]